MFKNVHNNKINDMIDKYNNTYKKTIKMKPVDVSSGIFVGFDKGNQ